MKLLNLLFLFLCFSCAVGKTRKKISQSEIYFKGGVSESKQWSEELSFKRFSWFNEVEMGHDVLVANIKTNSPFINWMKSNRTIVGRCEAFKVAMIYSNSSDTNLSFLKEEIEKSGFEIVSIPNFKRGLKSHANFTDWRLGYHRIIGLCGKKDLNISISIPGFQKYQLEM
jgi:hypothetical protein